MQSLWAGVDEECEQGSEPPSRKQKYIKIFLFKSVVNICFWTDTKKFGCTINFGRNYFKNSLMIASHFGFHESDTCFKFHFSMVETMDFRFPLWYQLKKNSVSNWGLSETIKWLEIPWLHIFRFV